MILATIIWSDLILSFLKSSFCSTVNVLPKSPKLKTPFIPKPAQNLKYHCRTPIPNDEAGINKVSRQALPACIRSRKTTSPTQRTAENIAPFLLLLISSYPMLQVPEIYCLFSISFKKLNRSEYKN
jgi:hypothetical protein